LRGLGGGCHVPIGAKTALEGGMLSLCGVVLSPDGARRIDADIAGPTAQAEALGQELARQLRERGADELLAM
jgi:hydroxymethylbilane synthase